MNIDKNWTEFKDILNIKYLSLQYIENEKDYDVWATESNVVYKCRIKKSPVSSDLTDFENNYKSEANKPIIPQDEQGKQYVRAESRPLDKTTFFTMSGDDTVIGDGKELRWNFANDDNDVTPSGVNYKKKQIDFTFIHEVNLKEGTIYFFDALWGSYLDLSIIAPAGVFHPTLEIPIGHFVNKHFITGTNNLGDELNTEAASQNIPAGFIFRLEVTVPDTDDSSKGYVSVEIYRPNTI